MRPCFRPLLLTGTALLNGTAVALPLQRTLPAGVIPTSPAQVEFRIYDGPEAATPLLAQGYGPGEFQLSQQGDTTRIAAELAADIEADGLWLEISVDGETRGERVALNAATPGVTFALGNALDMDTNPIVHLGAPASASDAATKGYVDAQIGGLTDETNDAVDSSELDNLCATDEQILKRSAGSWICADDAVGTGDNLGDHTATQNILLGTHWLSGDGGDEGVRIDADGKVGIAGTPGSANLLVGGIDGLLATGTYASGAIPLEGAGTRLMWYPGKAALRAGGVDGTQWDDTQVGAYSTAFGFNNLANGAHSTALGANTTAAGTLSTALGSGTSASGDYSTAMGQATDASGGWSIAMGQGTSADGDYSTAMGFFTAAESYAETVIGGYDTTYTPDTNGAIQWNPGDRLFVVGNGISDVARSDALVMLKSGDTTLNGQLSITDWAAASSTPVCKNGDTLADCSGVLGDNLGNHTATQDLNMASFKVSSVATPTLAGDAATKGYVDAQIGGLTDATNDAVDSSELDNLCGTDGQILKRIGGIWVCADDQDSGGTITAIVPGTGVSGGGTSGDVTVNVDFAGNGSAETASRSDHWHEGTPYAKVATVAVSGGDYTSPLDAMANVSTGDAWCGTPSATNRCLVQIMPGVFDLGTSGVQMQAYVSIRGSGEQTTKLTGAVSSATADTTSAVVSGTNNVDLSELTIENTGGAANSIGVNNESAAPTMTHLTATASGGSYNYGVRNNAASPKMTHVTATATGGVFSYGVSNTAASAPLMNEVSASASGSNNFAVYNNGSSPTLNNVTAIGFGGSSSYGVFNSSTAAPVMNNVVAKASGGSSTNLGLSPLGTPLLNNVLTDDNGTMTLYLDNDNTVLQGQLTVSTWAAATSTPVCRDGNTLADCSSINSNSTTATALAADGTNCPSGQYPLGVDAQGNAQGCSVDQVGIGDNLGDHITTQNIQLGSNWLSGDGGSEGIQVDANGKVGINAVPGSANLVVGGLDGLLVTGTYQSGAIPVEGAGTRLMWYPGMAAFRAGQVTGAQWDYAEIGHRSTALGYNTTASGWGATAIGTNTTASGDYSTAMGRDTYATGNYSTAMGYNKTASGDYSTVMGSWFGDATGNHSTAIGSYTHADGNYSTVIGHSITAQSYNEIVMGYFNTIYTPAPGGTDYAWNPSDRLFVIGNGTGFLDVERSDAMVVLKNGDTGFSESDPLARLHVRSGGDLSLAAAALLNEDLIIEDSGDSVLGIYSSESSNWGSAVVLGEVTGGALASKWGIARRTAVASTDANYLYFTYGTDANYGTNAMRVKFSPTGTAYKGNNSSTWETTSDVAVKQDVETIINALGTLMQVRPVTFRYTDEYQSTHPGLGDDRHYSVIAQEFAEVFPDAVSESGERLASEDRSILQVNIHPALITSIAAIQELNDKLEAENSALKAEIVALQTRMARQEQLGEEVAALREQLRMIAPRVAAGGN